MPSRTLFSANSTDRQFARLLDKIIKAGDAISEDASMAKNIILKLKRKVEESSLNPWLQARLFNAIESLHSAELSSHHGMR